MDNITLGQIKEIAIWFSVFASAIGSLYLLLMKGIRRILKPLEMKILKGDLTTFMYLAENGTLSNEQKLLAHEDFDEYIEDGGNSYIKSKFEKLVKEGKL